MTVEESSKGVEESMKKAQELQEEDDKLQAEIDLIHQEDNHAQQNEGDSISKFVNQEHATLLQEMGFSKIVAEKALFMTQSQGSTVEAALSWIDQHLEDADINEELRIVGQTEETKPKSNLSKEEKLQKAKELQDLIRKKRSEEEKIIVEEQEKNRVRITKELAEAKKKFDENQQKIEMDRQKREKQEFMDAKKRMLEQLERDKIERFGGKAATSGGVSTGHTEVVQKKDPIEQVRHGIKTVCTLYTEDRQPGVAKTCFKTISIYIGNILKNPTEEKYRKINLVNDAFQKRVGKITGGLSILKGVGFEEAGDQALSLDNYDEAVIKETLRLLENKL